MSNPSPAVSPNARVTVVDVDIRFGTMVWLMIKASFAAAIAAFVTGFLWAALAAVMFTALSAVGLGLGGLGVVLGQ